MSKIAVVVGSLRKESLNRKVAMSMSELVPAGMTLKIVEIGDLPLYNPDLDEGQSVPAPWNRFREEIKANDAVLFVTPEYNRSVTGVLKNAIDVGSRPYGKSAWSRKPAAVISVSPGAIGGFGANHHLRQSLVFLDMPALQQPEAYVGHANQLFDAAGKLINEGTRGFLQQFAVAFAKWIDTVSPSPVG